MKVKSLLKVCHESYDEICIMLGRTLIYRDKKEKEVPQEYLIRKVISFYFETRADHSLGFLVVPNQLVIVIQ